MAIHGDDQYPTISQIWLRHRDNIVPLFDDPMDIRNGIYITNAIGSFNFPPETLRERSLRKVIKTKTVFSDEEPVFKLMYLAMNNMAKRWTRPIKNWRVALQI